MSDAGDLHRPLMAGLKIRPKSEYGDIGLTYGTLTGAAIRHSDRKTVPTPKRQRRQDNKVRGHTTWGTTKHDS